MLLPREHGSPQAENAESVEAGGSGTVLLVEDNPDVASVSINLLEQLGYSVRRVADAETALREIDRDGIDLVFSDIVMPGKMDGLALAHRLREIRPDCRSSGHGIQRRRGQRPRRFSDPPQAL